MTEETVQQPQKETKRRWLRFGLAERVLVLTIVFVMLAEVAIFVPSIANFRNTWLRDKLSAAYTAALVLEAAPQDSIPAELKKSLLANVGAYTIALKMGNTRRLLAISDMPPPMVERYDLRSASPWEAIKAAYRTLTAGENRVVGIVGFAPMGGEFIEITLRERPLRAAMFTYSRNILLLSLVISLIVAGLAMTAIHLMVLRPVHRLTSNLTEFGSDPEDVSRIIKPSGRYTELGEAEVVLAQMQHTLADELKQKKHLAALGLAVAKINHDLRNMLASAQLMSDRLAATSDPLGKSLAPKLVATLDRAIAFCQSTLTYGRAVERPADLKVIDLHALASEAAQMASPPGIGRIPIINEIDEGFQVCADSEQVLRILSNLFRNAMDALENAGTQAGMEAIVTVRARNAQNDAAENTVVVQVIDTGPGIPENARARLFEAFQGSTRPGGTGLGLAIAAELVRAHGGLMELKDPAEGQGAVFQFTLPAADDKK